jgi:hypothetical protein
VLVQALEAAPRSPHSSTVLDETDLPGIFHLHYLCGVAKSIFA